MKIWRFALVAALAVLAFVLPTPPVQSDCEEYAACFEVGGCDSYCQCQGLSGGICAYPYPGNCLCY